MADIKGITKIRTSDNEEHYIDAKYWGGHEWGELANAFKYCGITTTELTDGATTNPVVIDGVDHTATAGCVVFYGDKEFVFNGTKWELLGGELTYKVVQTAVSSPTPSGSATAFIDSIEQDANGVITVTKKYLGKQYRLEYTATESLGHLSPCNIPSVLHEYDSVTGKGVFIYNDAPTSIRDEAFNGCASLTSITIPDSVTTIGEDAFCGCDGLTSVTIGDSVTSIGNEAFSSCTGELIINSSGIIGKIYTADDFPSNTWLKNAAFTKLTIGDSVTSIGNYAFLYCSSLTSVTIGDSVTTIGDYAFTGCSSLTSVTIPDSVTAIGDYAFYWCTNLISITIPDSVTSIGNYAFQDCSSLTSVTIGDSVTTIGDNAFSACYNLTSVTIPDSVTTIGESAFSSCNNLTSVTIGDSVTTIGDSAFAYCSSLTSVTIGDSVTTIGDSAFSGCDSLTSITIGDSVTTIGDSAFYDCDSLTSVTIGDSVTTIGEYVFSGCESLTSVTIRSENVPNLIGDWFSKGNVSKIYVPINSLDAYKSATYWSEYANIMVGCVFEDDFILVLLNDEIDNIVNSYFILSGSISGSGSGEGISMALDDESSDIYEDDSN